MSSLNNEDFYYRNSLITLKAVPRAPTPSKEPRAPTPIKDASFKMVADASKDVSLVDSLDMDGIELEL